MSVMHLEFNHSLYVDFKAASDFASMQAAPEERAKCNNTGLACHLVLELNGQECIIIVKSSNALRLVRSTD